MPIISSLNRNLKEIEYEKIILIIMYKPDDLGSVK